MAEKVVGFRIELKGDDQLSSDILRLNKQLKELTDQKKQLDAELKDNSVEKSAEDFDRLNKEIAETNLEIKQTRSELNKQQKDFLKTRQAVEATSGSYNDLVKRNQALRAELKALPNAFDKTNKKANDLKTEISQVTTELKQFDKELGDNFRSVGDYGSAISGLADQLKGLDFGGGNLKNAGGLLKNIIPQISKFGGVWGIAAGAVATGAVVATDALLDLTKEVNKANSQVQKLFGVTDNELQKLTSGIQATADTFGKEFNEVLLASNTLSKEFGISGAEALDLINKGFLAGADANGEFLDKLREYPTQFKASGFSAEEFITIATQEVKEGIFSDKGVDAVKEFGLRIREQTTATKDALNDAFGKEFSDKLLRGVRDGSISTAQALKQVSTALNQGGIEADRLQTVLADVFGGAGEDAGLRFLQTLKDVDGEIEGLVDDTDKYTQSQLELLDANQRIELAQQQIVAAFDLTGNELSGLTDQLQAFLLEGLVKLIDVGVDVINFFIDFYNESAIARAAVEFFGAQVSTIIDAVVLNFGVLFDAAKSVGGILKGVFTLDFEAIKSSFSEGFTNIKATIIDFGKNVATNYTEAFEATVEQRKPIEKISKEALFKPAEKAGTEAGTVAGEGFVEGFKTTTADQAKADSAAKKANEAAKKAFEKYFEPLEDLDFEVKPEIIIEPLEELLPEENFLQRVFSLDEEAQTALAQNLKNTIGNITEEVNNIVFQNLQKRLDRETNAQVDALEAQREAALDNENLTDAEKIAIGKKFDKQRSDLELKAAKKSRNLQAQQAVISAFLASGRALATPPGPPFTLPLAALALGEGLARAAAIRATPLALGGDFITDGPELLLVGDNPGGQERVQVTPLSSPNVNGPQVNQNFVNNQQGLDMDGMESRIAQAVITAIGAIPVVVSEGAITNAQKQVRVIQNESGF